MASREILLVAGEASGDLHAARMLTALRRMAPDLEAFGLGGKELELAGMELVAESSEVAVVGIAEALKILPRAREIFTDLLAEVEHRQTETAVLVDFPEFNLRLAKALKRSGKKVVYYISPQVWAWRKGRVRLISRVVDRMLVVFPFEMDFYRRHGVEAIHVGHPLIDEVPELPQVWDREQIEPKTYRIVLLPGSRKSEIDAHLPTLLQAAELIAAGHPVEFTLIKAQGIAGEHLESYLSRTSIKVSVVSEDRFATIADSHLALCVSGTATVEVGLLGTPMIVVYRVRGWTYVLGKMLVDLPHLSMVNLVLEREAVPELIQRRANPVSISREALGLLSDRDRIRSMRSAFAELRGRLGARGASRRAAEQVLAVVYGNDLGRGRG
jgi:lipid-A-disaccharide synthase